MTRRRPWRPYFTLVVEALPSARGLLPLVALLGVWQALQTGNSPYFPPPLGVVERPDAAREKRAALSCIVRHDHNPAPWIGFGGLDRNQHWSADWSISAVEPRLRAASRISEAIPPPAVVPVAILFMGYDERMKLTVVVLAAIWPILLNTSSAAERVDPLLLDVARSFRLSALIA
jgi:ABC-type nitrate/sulfonate/bicarbonate transport system permease component